VNMAFESVRRSVLSYTIMIIPRGSARIRRFEFSRRALRLSAIGLATFAITICVGTVSLFAYRHLYLATEDVRVNAAKYVLEREGLINEISEMQNALGRVKRFESKFSAVADNDAVGSDFNATGKGPIADDAWNVMSNASVSPSSASLRFSGGWHTPFAGILGKNLKFTLDKLSKNIDITEKNLHASFSMQSVHPFFWSSIPTLWPTRGWVTSHFGDIRAWGGGRHRRHEGVDIAAPIGTSIMAPGGGIVTFTGYKHGYGKTIMIDHGYGIVTLYGHCHAILVKEGQRVKRGMLVGMTGNTGHTTGPHLHYEVRVDGIPVDPMMYIMNGA